MWNDKTKRRTKTNIPPEGWGLIYKLQEGSGKWKESDNLHNNAFSPILCPAMFSTAFVASSFVENLTNGHFYQVINTCMCEWVIKRSRDTIPISKRGTRLFIHHHFCWNDCAVDREENAKLLIINGIREVFYKDICFIFFPFLFLHILVILHIECWKEGVFSMLFSLSAMITTCSYFEISKWS